MGTMDDLVRATKINTKGLIRGNWNRMASDKTPSQMFQSGSHPNFELKFTQAWLVEIKNETEDFQYTYCWDATQGYLTDITDGPQEDHNLSVVLLEVEAETDKDCQIIKDLTCENEKSESKIDDLNKQVQSFQFICCRQQEKIKNLLEKLKNKNISQDKDKNAEIVQSPFIHNPSGNDISKRPQKSSQLLAHYDTSNNSRCAPPPVPFGPILQQPDDPNMVPLPRTYAPLPYGGHVGPFRAYDPYFPHMPHLAFNHPMPYRPSIWDHNYGAPLIPVSYPPFPTGPPPIIAEPAGMRPPQRIDGQMPLGNWGPAHQQHPRGAQVARENTCNATENRSNGRNMTHRQIINTDLKVNQMSRNRHDESKMEQNPIREHKCENQFNPVAQLPICVEKQKPNGSHQSSVPFTKPKALVPKPRPSPIKSQIQSQKSTGLIMGPHDPAGDDILRQFQHKAASNRVKR